ncbi:hypothetical protein D3C84_1260060 [compost metagenome]
MQLRREIAFDFSAEKVAAVADKTIRGLAPEIRAGIRCHAQLRAVGGPVFRCIEPAALREHRLSF